MPCCSFWPYKFVSQILARLVEQGVVNLQTNTPVLKVGPSGDRNLLITTRGVLMAEKVIFATNGYTAGLCSAYKDNITPIRGTASHIVPTKPIYPHLSHTYNIAYQRPDNSSASRVDYLNSRPNGSIVVGGGKWTFDSDDSNWWNTVDDSVQLPQARPHFNTLMQRHFRGWEDSGAEVESMWTGIMGYTTDGMPHVGEVPGQEGKQWLLAGFNGGGNALIWLTAKGLADMVVNGTAFEDTDVPILFKTSKERLWRPKGPEENIKTA
jgi:glycine/D-amino acid oxidase-like deaminating enzyme